MAILQTITMDLSFGDYDSCPLMGATASDPLILAGATEGASLMAGIESPSVYNFEADLLDLSHSIYGPDSSVTQPETKIEDLFTFDSGETSHFEDGVFDLESLVAECQDQAPPAVHYELPAKAGSSAATVNSAASFTDFTFSSWGKPECDASAPGSPDSGISSSVPSPCSLPDHAHSSPSLPTMSAEALDFLSEMWSNDPVTPENHTRNAGTETVLTTLILDSSDGLKLPIQPESSRKSRKSKSTKSLTHDEKKERKRAQNKNAATRYREKKRAEAKVVFEEQTGMEENNRSLKEKVTLLTREIQYMKEILTEVYRAKGLVE